MRRRFLKVNNQIFTLWYVVIQLGILLQGSTVQSQNPFDIKSRKSVDSISVYGSADSILISDTTVPGAIIPEDSIDFISPIDTASTLEKTNTDKTQKKYREIILVDPPAQSNHRGLLEGMGDVTEDTGIQSHSNWWYYIFDLVLLLFLLGAFLYDRKVIHPIRKAFLHENYLRFLYRDTYVRKPGIYLYLNIIFLLNLGFILFRVAQYMNLAAGLRDYFIIQGVVLLLFIIKHISLELLANLVDKPFEVRFYRYWMILSAGLIGLWLIPVTLMLSVLPDQYMFIALLCTCIPLGLLLIYRQIKAMIQAKFFLSKHFFHFFLYFCAVEVVPVLILADILVNY